MDSVGDIPAVPVGARVRADAGYLGTVEGLAAHGGAPDALPDSLIVRADDGQWRYAIPLLLVRDVSQAGATPVVRVALGATDLPYYVIGSIGHDGEAVRSAPPAFAAPRVAGAAAAPMLALPLAIEDLVVRKHAERRGTVRIHKGVRTRQVRQVVPVYIEQAEVERIPAARFDPSAPVGPDETIIPVLEERLVVRKQTIVTEYIRVRKRVVRKRYAVEATLRQEVAEISQQAPREVGRQSAQGYAAPAAP